MARLEDLDHEFAKIVKEKNGREGEDKSEDCQIFADSQHHPASIDQVFVQEGDSFKLFFKSKCILYYASSSERKEDLVEGQNAVGSCPNQGYQDELPVEVLLLAEAPLQEVVEDDAVKDWLNMREIGKCLNWEKKCCIR